jgi:hypothetical protein
MGLFAMGTRAFGNSFGFDVNVFSDTPGPQRMRAWKPVEGKVACGMLDGKQNFAAEEGQDTTAYYMLPGKSCGFRL